MKLTNSGGQEATVSEARLNNHSEATEVSQQQKTEKLRVITELHRGIFENVWYGIGILDRHGKILECNPACSRLTGFPHDALIGKQMADFIPPHRLTDIHRFRKQIDVQGKVYLETEILKADGALCAVEVTGSSYQYHGQEVTLGFMRDIAERKEAETALQDSQRTLANLMNNMPGMAYRCNVGKQYQFSFVSEGCKDLTGYDDRDFITDKIKYASLIHPDDRTSCEKLIQEAIEQKIPYRLTYRLMTALGYEKWVWEQGCGIFSLEGELQGLEGFITDISERKRATESLSESEAFHRGIVENSWAGITILNMAGYFVEANPAFCRMLGYTRSELIGRHITEVIHKEHRHKWFDFLRDIEREGVTKVHAESMDVRKDGKEVDLEIASSVVTLRGRPMVVTVSRDITERKRAQERLESHVRERTKALSILNQELKDEISVRKYAEKALIESKDRYLSLVETIPHGIDEVSLDGTILFANSALHKMYLCEPGSLIGTSILDRVSTDAERMNLREHLLKLMRDQPKPEPYFGKKTKVNGEEIDIQVDWDYRRDSEGRVIGFITVVTDITERKLSGEKLRVQDRELAHVARVSTMGEMATGLAHELNQPLAAIVNYTRGCIRRLDQQNSDSDKLVEMMQKVVKEAERAALVIKRMRDFVKKGELLQVEVNVNEVVRDSLAFFEHEAEKREVTILLHLADDLPVIYADPTQLSQVFVNIIKNALEALRDGKIESPQISIDSFLFEARCVRVRIQNTGPSVSSELFHKMFDPFFTTKKEGMGMGLSISRTIVEAHGGALIPCDELKDGGACFITELPLPKRRA